MLQRLSIFGLIIGIALSNSVRAQVAPSEPYFDAIISCLNDGILKNTVVREGDTFAFWCSGQTAQRLFETARQRGQEVFTTNELGNGTYDVLTLYSLDNTGDDFAPTISGCRLRTKDLSGTAVAPEYACNLGMPFRGRYRF